MLITNVLDFYDQSVLGELKKHFTSVQNTKWLITPSDIAFPMSKKEFGQVIFPLYTVWRTGPANKTPTGSLAAMSVDFKLGNGQAINFLNVGLKYQIDFYSRSMYEVNLSNSDHLKFQCNSKLYFDLTQVGVRNQPLYEVPVKHFDSVDNSSFSDYFNVGRYFRYIDAIYFDLIEGVVCKEIIFGLYNVEKIDSNKLGEITIDEDYESPDGDN